MRFATLSTISILALAACSPKIPDSAAGVSAAPVAGTVSQLPQAAMVSTQPLNATGLTTTMVATAPTATPSAAPFAAPSEGADIAAQTTAALGLPASTDVATTTTTSTSGAPLSALSAPAAAAPAAAIPVAVAEDGTVATAAAISDEQSFNAVAERETIESDAARIAANRAQYQMIQPTDLPPRPDGSGASIVAFALATTNAPGQPLYKRSSTSERRFQTACAKHGSADIAQEYFLDHGGPERDSSGIDPDGDGFACYWDPMPFRAARGGAAEVVTKYVDVETSG